MSSRKNFTAKEAKDIGERLGIKWDKFDIEQFRAGMDVELEHGLTDPATNVTNDDLLITGKIALAHLNEFSDYYDRLEEMEEEAEGKNAGRKGEVTLKGNALTLEGPGMKVGQKAPDFTVLSQDLEEKKLSDFSGKIKLIASVPSLDTPVCDTEIKRFNDEAAKISKDVVIIFISMDLPFAQKRFCQEFDIKTVKTLSDHKDASFGSNYGVLIKEMRLLARAIFIIGKDDTIKYVQLVKELSSGPDYNAALAALKKETGIK